MIDHKQREEKFASASDKEKYFYESYETAIKIAEIARRHSIVELPPFTIAIGDVILGLVPQEQLPQLLIERLQVTQPVALRITADVLDFLEPLNQPTTASTPIGTQPQPTEVIEQPVDSPDTLAAELAETEAAFKQIQPIRTMAHDMETIKQTEEPVHQAASQESILNGQGNAEKNAAAQWGTPEK